MSSTPCPAASPMMRTTRPFARACAASCRRRRCPMSPHGKRPASSTRRSGPRPARSGCSARPCPRYGGLGLDFRYNAISRGAVLRRLAPASRCSPTSSPTTSCNYGSEEQKQQWLPQMVSGEAITAIAMTEPGTGSDLQGVRTTAQTRRQRLRRQRLEDLHHQRPERRPGHRRRQDRSRRAGAQGHLADPGRGRPRRLQARPQPRQDRPAFGRHLRAVLRGRARADRPTAWARRARASPI